MAESPAHKFGQVIGELHESIIRPYLEQFCQKQGLYLDYQRKERPARHGRKVSWEDPYGNHHDLDFVIEKHGNDYEIGQPVAFIEVAWRRYTKHSRNKVQEIQGAILPLAEKYKWNNPFLGAILAGVFTTTSLDQLRSLGFQTLYFPYETIVAAFAAEDIDIRFDESTPDEVYRKCTERIENTSDDVMRDIKEQLIRANSPEISRFFSALDARLGRSVRRVIVIPLYGRVNEFLSIQDALNFLDLHAIYEGSGEFRKYEIFIEFSNGDKVEASLSSKQQVHEFLRFVETQ
jgi:hypothetical protein